MNGILLSVPQSGATHIRSTGATGSHDVRQPARRSWRKDAELRREYGLDSTLAETFPCSDPLSSIPDPHSDWDRS